MYSDANDFGNSQVFTGLRFTYGSSGALTLNYRNSAGNLVTTGLTTSSFSQATVYTIEIVGNNKSSGTISYTYNGASQTVAVQKFDLYINGTLVGDDLSEDQLTSGSNVTSLTFIGISSTSNAANAFVDDVVIYNAVPAAIGSTPATTNYYSAATGNLDDVNTWWSNTDGATGSHPSNFTTATQVFNVRNRSTATIGANWVVSGGTSKIVVGDGSNACNFTIPSNFTVTGTVDVAAAATLTNQNSANPTLGTLNATSTVDYNGTGAQTVAAANYGNLTISGSRAATPTITLASGTIDAAGIFSVTESGAVTYVNTGNTVNFSSASSQTIPAINYLNITNTGNGVRTLPSTGTVGIAGAFTPGTANYTVTGSTLLLNGAGGTTITLPSVASGNNLNALQVKGTGGSYTLAPRTGSTYSVASLSLLATNASTIVPQRYQHSLYSRIRQPNGYRRNFGHRQC